MIWSRSISTASLANVGRGGISVHRCRNQTTLILVAGLATLSVVEASYADSWSKPVAVRRDLTECVSYRAQFRKDWLIIEARHESDWHTYAMDNKKRAARALKGEEPLGMELPTEINLSEGLKAIGPWYQTKPDDLSKPELRWYSWGFSKTSTFAVRVEQTGASSAVVSIRGQACDAKSCLGVKVSIPLPLNDDNAPRSKKPVDLSKLVRVER